MIYDFQNSCSLAGTDQHEAIGERIKSLCRKSDYFRGRVHDLKRTRVRLEERRQTLVQQNRQLDQEILNCQSSLEETTSQCQVQMERTRALKEKLIVQSKRKKEFHYANLWIRTGTACGAVFHILRLRKDLQKLKRQMFTSEQYSKHVVHPKDIFSADRFIVAGLQRVATLTESNLAALAKETSVTHVGPTSRPEIISGLRVTKPARTTHIRRKGASERTSFPRDTRR